jgi:hypothetical protein
MKKKMIAVLSVAGSADRMTTRKLQRLSVKVWGVGQSDRREVWRHLGP